MALTFYQAIVKRILEISEKRGITLSKWSSRAMLSSATLYDIVHGKSTNPGMNTIKKLCDAVKISLPKFFDVDYIRDSVVLYEEDDSEFDDDNI